MLGRAVVPQHQQAGGFIASQGFEQSLLALEIAAEITIRADQRDAPVAFAPQQRPGMPAGGTVIRIHRWQRHAVRA